MNDPSALAIGEVSESSLALPTKEVLAQIVAKQLHLLHLADLHASGLTDATIASHEFRTISDPKVVARMLNWSSAKGAAKLGPCLEIPFFDIDGNRTGFSRLKPLTPRKETRDGKVRVVKYEQPLGVGNHAYFPIGLASPLRGDDAIAITEGEKKAIALTQNGLPTIGLTGISNWGCEKKVKGKARKPSDKHELIADLAAIDWHRNVSIIIDGEVRRNANVLFAANTLAVLLAEFGARPTVVPLQPLPGVRP